MIYDLDGLLPARAFQRDARGQIKPQSGGGSGAPAQQNVTTTSIPEYARPYVEKSLGQAAALTDINKNPYQPYGGQQVAAFSPLQAQAMQNVSGQGVSSQIAEGSNIASQAGQYALQTPERARQLQNQSLGYGAQGANLGILGGGLYGGQAAAAGSQYASQATNPNSVNAYMSPYMQNAVDVQKQEAIRDYQKTMPMMGAQAVKSGAFGGSRQAITEAEAQRNVNTQLANIQATGSQQAYDKAMQSMQFGSNLGLQGLQTGLQGVNTQLAGTGQGMQGVQGAVGAGQYGLAGLGVANQSANTLGQLGQTQFQQEMAITDAQMRAGAMQQAQEQKGLDILQQQYADSLNYPYKQLGFQSDMFRGLPMSQGAQSMYQNPSIVSQAAGLGTAAYGLYQMGKKNGGEIKMADGGITSLFDVGGEVKSDLYQMEPEDLQAYIKKSSSATAKKMAIQILAEKQFQERQQGAGVAALPSNLPVGNMADGGIIAFADEGEVVDPNAPVAPAVAPVVPPAAVSKYGGIEAISPEGRAKFAEYEGLLKDLRGKGGSEREQAKNMAIFQAGLGMMGGTSPNPFANIAAGAAPAVTQYQSALKDIRKEDRDTLKQMLDLGVSKEQFLQKAQQMGIDVYKADKAYDAQIRAAGMRSAAEKQPKSVTEGDITDAQIKNGVLIDSLTAIAKTRPLTTEEQASLNTARASSNTYMSILSQKRPVQPNAAIPNAVTTRLEKDGPYNDLELELVRARNNPTKQEEIKKKMDARVLEIQREVVGQSSQGRGTGGTGGNPPTPAPASQPLPMPKSAADAVVGQLYNTTRGPAKWDGKQFILAQ